MTHAQIVDMVRTMPLTRDDFYTANSLMKALKIVPNWQYRDMVNQSLIIVAKSSFDEFHNREFVMDWYQGPGKLYR